MNTTFNPAVSFGQQLPKKQQVQFGRNVRDTLSKTVPGKVDDEGVQGEDRQRLSKLKVAGAALAASVLAVPVGYGFFQAGLRATTDEVAAGSHCVVKTFGNPGDPTSNDSVVDPGRSLKIPGVHSFECFETAPLRVTESITTDSFDRYATDVNLSVGWAPNEEALVYVLTDVFANGQNTFISSASPDDADLSAWNIKSQIGNENNQVLYENAMYSQVRSFIEEFTSLVPARAVGTAFFNTEIEKAALEGYYPQEIRDMFSAFEDSDNVPVVNEDGNIVDPNGNVFDEEGNIIETLNTEELAALREDTRNEVFRPIPTEFKLSLQDRIDQHFQIPNLDGDGRQIMMTVGSEGQQREVADYTSPILISAASSRDNSINAGETSLLQSINAEAEEQNKRQLALQEQLTAQVQGQADQAEAEAQQAVDLINAETEAEVLLIQENNAAAIVQVQADAAAGEVRTEADAAAYETTTQAEADAAATRERGFAEAEVQAALEEALGAGTITLAQYDALVEAFNNVENLNIYDLEGLFGEGGADFLSGVPGLPGITGQ